MHIIFIFGAKYLIFIVAIIFVLFFLFQERGVRTRLLLFSIAALPAIYIVAKIVALVFYDPRPFVVGHFEPLVAHAPDNGFPSDHALLGGALASVLYPFNKYTSMVLWVLTLMVGVSRVYVGVHHIVDIAGSVVIAIIVSWAIYRWIRTQPWYVKHVSNQAIGE